MDFEAVEKAALSLSRKERVLLVESLSTSLIRERPDPEIERAWIAEIDRRVKEVEEGRTIPIPLEKVLRNLRKKYKISSALTGRKRLKMSRER